MKTNKIILTIRKSNTKKNIILMIQKKLGAYQELRLLKFKMIVIISMFFLLINVCYAIDNNNTEELSHDPLNDTVVIGVSDNENKSINNESNIVSQHTNNEIVSVSDTSSYEKIYDTCTIEDRTFKFGKYKATISKTRFTNLYTAKDAEEYYWWQGGYDSYHGQKLGDFGTGEDGLYYEFQVFTNKYIKQVIGKGYLDHKVKLKEFKSKNKALKYKKAHKNKYDMRIKKVNGRYVVYKVNYKKLVTKKAKVYMVFSYGAAQYGMYPSKYTLTLTTNYENPAYDIVRGWIGKYKVSSSLFGLNTAKIKSY